MCGSPAAQDLDALARELVALGVCQHDVSLHRTLTQVEVPGAELGSTADAQW